MLHIHTRVSTAIQVDGYSLDAQKEKLRRYAEYQEMEIAHEYSDEGFSGKKYTGQGVSKKPVKVDGMAALLHMDISLRMENLS
nr:recombinase family protein [Lachnobacterium bovis]